ncbi:MAG: lipopolysaccharide assembly protein LapA domain-containing protein [Zoogloeaceae bacterium]|nr:lipopolysaccharide assembly protein LapA domain-containing protein [Zoogloeaceae bacterium]
MILLTLLAIFLTIVAGVFAIQNHAPVTVQFFFWSLEGSLALLLLGALATGALIVTLINLPAALRNHWNLKQQKKRIEELERTCARLAKDSAPTTATTTISPEEEKHAENKDERPG